MRRNKRFERDFVIFFSVNEDLGKPDIRKRKKPSHLLLIGSQSLIVPITLVHLLWLCKVSQTVRLGRGTGLTDQAQAST